MMKKYLSVLLCAIVLITALAGCGEGNDNAADPDGSSTSDVLNSKEPSGDDSDKGEETPDVSSLSVELVQEQLYKYESSIGYKNVVYMAEIRNNGTVPLSISDVSIDLEDVNGAIIASSSYASAYNSEINPGECAYICESLISLDKDIDLDTVGAAVLHYDLDELKSEVVYDVTLSEITLGEEYGMPKVVGRATNNTDEELKYVYIVAPVKDADGVLQTICLAMVDSIPAGETRGFDQGSIYVDPNLDFSNSTITAIPYPLF